MIEQYNPTSESNRDDELRMFGKSITINEVT